MTINETEKDIQTRIKQYLEYKGFYVYRNHQTLGSHKGLADLTAGRDGVGIWIEVKKPNGKQSDDQKKFQAAIEAVGLIYIIARGEEDLFPLVETLDDIKRKRGSK